MSLDDRLAAVDAAPAGPAVAALFDAAALCAPWDEPPLASWAGLPPAELEDASRDTFRGGGAAGLRYEAWALVGAHQARGHTVALVDAGRVDRLQPVAAEFGIEHVHGAAAEVVDGRLTGGLAPQDDVVRATAFAAVHDLDLADAYAYAAADAGLLEAVGHPAALAPDAALRQTAAARGWPVVDAFDRVPGRLDGLRTAASYAGFLGAAAGGLTAGLLRGRRRTGADTMSRVFGTVGPVVSGISVNAQGAEHARAHRPAVFLLNHQSSLVDAIVTFHLLRDGFTPVAKKEVKDIPLLGPATALAGWAYVDRVGDRAQAVAAISDAVDKLHAGVSVILAPEGTRSVGPLPGAFKKGAFYMAREAGVPVIPIVIRNAGELMWRSAKALKPGTVDVVVHPPISCDWADDEFDVRVAEVRDLYVRTLERWPAAA